MNSICAIAVRWPFLLVSIFLQFFAIYLRRHFEIDWLGHVYLELAAVFLICGPDWVVRKVLSINHGIASILCFSVFMIMGLCFPTTGGVLLMALTCIWLYFTRNKQNQSNGNTMPALIHFTATVTVLILFSLVIIHGGWNTQYMHPLFDEALALGNPGRDVINQLGYTNIFQKYHVFGAGIHGLSTTPYHHGATVFRVALSNLIHRGPSFCLNMGHVTVLIPGMFQAFYRFILDLMKERLGKSSDLFVLTGMFALTAHILPTDIVVRRALWESYFESQSHPFGLWMACIYLSSCLFLFFSTPTQFTAGTKILRKFAIQFGLPLFLGWVVFAKVSLGIVAGMLYGIMFLILLYRTRHKAGWVGAMLSLMIGVGVFLICRPEMSSAFSANYFINTWGGGDVLKFYVIHFYPLWLLLIITDYRDFKCRLLALFTFTAFLISIPAINMTIEGGSGYYFTNIPMWLAMPGIIVGLPRILKKYPWTKWITAAACAVAVCNSIHAAMAIRVLDKFSSELPRILNKEPNPNFQVYLRAFDKIAKTTPQDVMVFVPYYENLPYWHSFPEKNSERFDQWWCQKAGLIITTQTQRPAIFGIQRDITGCMEDFAPRNWVGQRYLSLPQNPTEKEVCSEVRRFKFDKFITLMWDPTEKTVQTRTIKCS